MMRYRSRVDGNQKEIAELLRKAGFSVFHTHAVGRGFPDMVIGKHGMTWLAECKMSKGKFTDSQKKFYESWRGGLVIILRSLEESRFFINSVEQGIEHKKLQAKLMSIQQKEAKESPIKLPNEESS